MRERGGGGRKGEREREKEQILYYLMIC